jgi:hypothetical protein
MITHKNIGYSGRLGNQMFQYAALKALSLKTGYELFLPDNLSIKPDGCFDMTSYKWIEYKLDLLDCFKLDYINIDKKSLPNQYQEQRFSFEPEIFDIIDNTAIEGYFQSYKYFEDYKDEILKEFTFKSNILNKCSSQIKNHTNPVSIHVRRGDYVNHPGFWNVTPEYLQESLNYFNDDDYTFLIFSDDIEWCKQVFPDGVVFIEGNNQFEDLCLMSLCDHNIISNSSYSWWGAYLNQNPNKRIIAPKNWFTDQKPLNDLYPNNFIII